MWLTAQIAISVFMLGQNCECCSVTGIVFFLFFFFIEGGIKLGKTLAVKLLTFMYIFGLFQCCIYMDKPPGGSSRTRRQRKRGTRLGSPGNKCGTRGTLPHRRGCRHGRSRGHSNQFKRGETTDAFEGRVPG